MPVLIMRNPLKYLFVLSHQNAAEELLLKSNFSIYFIFARNRYIASDLTVFITGNYDPFCFMIVVPVINGDDLSGKLMHRNIHTQEIDILLRSVTTHHAWHITIVYRIYHFFVPGMAASHRTVDFTFYVTFQNN